MSEYCYRAEMNSVCRFWYIGYRRTTVGWFGLKSSYTGAIKKPDSSGFGKVLRFDSKEDAEKVIPELLKQDAKAKESEWKCGED